MKIPVYSVRDVLTGFKQLMTDVNDNTAQRNFGYAINQDNDFGFNAKDFDLYRIGTFDEETGFFECEPVPKLIVTGASMRGVNVK